MRRRGAGFWVQVVGVFGAVFLTGLQLILVLMLLLFLWWLSKH